MTSWEVRPVKSSLLLQLLLHYNVYLSIFWAIVYILNILYNLVNLLNFEGFFILFVFMFGFCIEIARLETGYNANLNMQPAMLIIFLTLSPIIVPPILLFLRFASFNLCLLIDLSTFLLCIFILLEFVVGIFTYVTFYKLKHDLQYWKEVAIKH